MIRIFYISKASEDLTAKDHNQILDKARRNNARLGVTGLLVIKDGYFAQALEGEEAAVNELLSKIEKDPRHSGVVVLSREEADHRIFPGWEMGYRDLNCPSLSPEVREVDLADERFVKEPAELSFLFRGFVESQPQQREASGQ